MFKVGDRVVKTNNIRSNWDGDKYHQIDTIWTIRSIDEHYLYFEGIQWGEWDSCFELASPKVTTHLPEFLW